LADAEVPELIAELHEAQQELRTFTQGVRPAALDIGGLPAALPRLAARAGIPVDLDVDGVRFPAAVEAAVYFICAEALSNVDKHAHASRAWIRVQVAKGEVAVQVRDNGIGGADLRGSGLRGLVDRADALGGRLTVHTGKDGTTLSTCIPLSEDGQR
jgi:signal transduction histidine kinase